MHSLAKYFTPSFKGNFFGGVTAAIVSLPLALAFGIASGAGAEAGLYGAILVGLFAALFGGTPTLISEPTGPMTVVMTALIASLVAADGENGMAMAFTVVMLAGLFQLLFGLLKLGNYITLMPYSVVSGFMSGIGLILIIMQLAPVLGQAPPAGGVIAMVQALPELLMSIRWHEFALALATLALIYLSPTKLNKRCPPQLLALVLLTPISLWLFADVEFRRIGEIQVGMPQLQLPVFSAEQWQIMLLDGLALGLLGCIDSMLTSVIADNLTRTEHKSNRELVGQGIGNMVSGLFGGLPGAGATMGTVVNIQAGGNTNLAGIIRVIALLIAVYGMSGLLESVPLAVLAAIALKVGLDILDWSFIKRAHRVSWQSTLVMYAVIALTLVFDLIVAVGVGVFVANILIIEKLSRSQHHQVHTISDMDDAVVLSKKEKQWLSQVAGKVLLVYLSGPIIFGVARALSRIQRHFSSHDVIVLDLSAVSMLDDTICLSLENTIIAARQEQKEVVLVIEKAEIRQHLERIGVLQHLPLGSVFTDRKQALQALQAL